MNFWKTVEVDAWSRDFNYNDYRLFHLQTGCEGKPLDLDTYDALCDILNIQMEDQLK